MILVGSGNSHTFFSCAIASQLQGIPLLHQSLQVKVASGDRIVCQQQLQGAKWEVQGYKFVSDHKVSPLQHFNMIVGYDWLEQYSPMKVHWKAKWMAIPYDSETIVVQGILSQLDEGVVVQVFHLTEEGLGLDSDDSNSVVDSVLVEVQKLFDAYADTFASKVVFPSPSLSVILSH
jgi:hypothetical protein